jgi:hypothetical protein
MQEKHNRGRKAEAMHYPAYHLGEEGMHERKPDGAGACWSWDETFGSGKAIRFHESYVA